MNKDHIVHLPGSLDRVSCQHLIDVFESLNDYHDEGRIGGHRIDYDSKKCTELMFKLYDDSTIHPIPTRDDVRWEGKFEVPFYTEPDFTDCLVNGFKKYAQELSLIHI